MRSLTVGENDKNQRLDKFMHKTFKTLPGSLMQKYIRLKCVKANGKHVKGDYILKKDDVLSFYISDEYFVKSEIDFKDLKPAFKVIYEDDNVLIVDKPCGLLCQPDDTESRNTLDNHIKAYLYQKGEYIPENENSFAPALCHRIDKNTQGLVISAKNFESLTLMNEIIKTRQLHKYYYCLVFGIPKPKATVLKGYLRKDSGKNTVDISDKYIQGYKEIKTAYSVIAYDEKNSLVKVELLTGRTHQIRAHMAHIGHPLLGDTKYGTSEENRGYPFKYQALSSCEILFDFSDDMKKLNYLNKKHIKTEMFFEEYALVKKMLKLE